MNSGSSKLWVGVFRTTGALVVFDSALQVSGPTQVNLFSLNLKAVRGFPPDQVREILEAARGVERDHALDEYARWRAIDEGKFVRDEVARLEAESAKMAQLLTARREETIERHRLLMERNGYSYRGTRRSSRKARTARCWNCHVSLDNAVDVECGACGWILCNCGACGCGRERTNARWPTDA